MNTQTRSIQRTLRSAILLSAALLSQAGCAQAAAGPDPEAGLVYGAPVTLGAGTARTYLIMQNGAPTEIGVALSERALENLPAGHHHGEGPHAHFAEFLLPLPTENPTPFKLVELNWNPAGHEPEPIYGLPHFDFHFYTITEAERNAIDASDPEFARKADNLPPAEYLPQNYIHTGVPVGGPPSAAAVPRMGLHWIDPASPEFNGQTFARTFIYGSWDGKLIFLEPMITKALIESKPDLTLPIATPQRFSPAGAYPSNYRIYWNPETREYRIALGDLSTR